MTDLYDVIIIGAGPAGLSAGIYAAERHLKTLILEINKPGGQPGCLYPKKFICDYPVFLQISGGELAGKMTTHVQQAGVLIKTSVAVKNISVKENKILEIGSDKESFQTKSVILAVGIGLFNPRKLGVEGEDLPNVYHNIPDPEDFKEKNVLCVGGGDTAVEMALTACRNQAKEIFLAHRSEEFRACEKTIQDAICAGVKVLTPFNVNKIKGDGKAEEVSLINSKTQEEKTLKVDMVCINAGFIPDLSFLEQWNLKTENRAVVVDKEMQTSREGIFACGDVTIPLGGYKRITIAEGQAAYAVNGVYKYLKQPSSEKNDKCHE